MVFSNLTFLFIFLPVVLAVYFISPRFIRNTVLFALSLVFYAWGEPKYVWLMLFTTAINYFAGIFIDKYRGEKWSKISLVTSIVISLGLLFVFKYAGFTVRSINGLLGAGVPVLNLALPIGISFYTFQVMSYNIDLYRGLINVQRNFISFGSYVTLFPQLVAGPIVRYSTVAEQLDNRRENPDMFGEGVRRFTMGLGKKVLLADNIEIVWRQFSALEASDMSVLGAWLGIIAYAFHIYFDFSGYSDMAIGLGKIFGFNFLENFNYPYISKSITEFWRRWHISLGTWFREYVYIPLGGNRKGIASQLRNIAIVWALTGIWHGASWNFVVWGLYYCVLLVIEKLFLLKLLEKAPSVISRVYTLFFVLMGWVIFAIDDFGKVAEYFTFLFGMAGLPLVDNRSIFSLLSNAILLVMLVFGSTPMPGRLARRALDILGGGDKPGVANKIVVTTVFSTAMLFILIVSVAYLVNSTFSSFLYLRF